MIRLHNQTPLLGSNHLLYQIHTWYVEKDAVKINKKERKEQKNINECSLDGAWTSSIFDRVSCEEETKTAVNETTRLKRNPQRWHNFFCQLPKFFPSTSLFVLAIPNPARQKDIFFSIQNAIKFVFRRAFFVGQLLGFVNGGWHCKLVNCLVTIFWGGRWRMSIYGQSYVPTLSLPEVTNKEILFNISI